MRRAACATIRRLLVAAIIQLAHASSKSGHTVVKAFLRVLGQAPAGQRAIILDIGANNGHWGATVMNKAREAAPNAQIELVYFEPQDVQPRLRTSLQKELQSHAKRLGNTTVVHAAAWIRNTTLNFYMAERDSQASSTVKAVAKRFSGGSVRIGKKPVKQIRIPAIDLADFLRRRLKDRSSEAAERGSRRRPLVLLKLDIEAAEFQVLPHLLVSGIACSVRFWLMEWHLAALHPRDRLSNVMLRRSMDGLLSRGCASASTAGAESQRNGTHRASVVVQHDDVGINNEGVVPGLYDLAELYDNRSAGWQSAQYTLLHEPEKWVRP